MREMNPRVRFAVAGALATTLAGGWVATASAAEEEDFEGIKQAACRSFGCNGGPRNCFDGQVTLKHPTYGSVSVHLWCYEP